MTTYTHRLTSVMKELSAKQRAILTLRSWLSGEPLASELLWSMPDDQRADYDRLVSRYEDANNEFGFIATTLGDSGARSRPL
jgi:hypothetical protein